MKKIINLLSAVILFSIVYYNEELIIGFKYNGSYLCLYGEYEDYKYHRYSYPAHQLGCSIGQIMGYSKHTGFPDYTAILDIGGIYRINVL